MTKREAASFAKDYLVGQLWPKWQMTKEQFDVWVNVLRHFNEKAARQAARQCYAEASYTSPQLAMFREKAKAISLSMPSRAASKPVETDIFIACTGPRGYRKVGTFSPLHVATPNADTDPLKAAQGLAAKYSELYGGQWQVARSNHLAMSKWRYETRQKLRQTQE